MPVFLHMSSTLCPHLNTRCPPLSLFLTNMQGTHLYVPRSSVYCCASSVLLSGPETSSCLGEGDAKPVELVSASKSSASVQYEKAGRTNRPTTAPDPTPSTNGRNPHAAPMLPPTIPPAICARTHQHAQHKRQDDRRLSHGPRPQRAMPHPLTRRDALSKRRAGSADFFKLHRKK